MEGAECLRGCIRLAPHLQSVGQSGLSQTDVQQKICVPNSNRTEQGADGDRATHRDATDTARWDGLIRSLE